MIKQDGQTTKTYISEEQSRCFADILTSLLVPLSKMYSCHIHLHAFPEKARSS
jgi:hypothetical protein